MKENDVEILLDETSQSLYRDLSFKIPKSMAFETPKNTTGLKSQALDSLINQNEDLMARLRASTKRTGALEDQLDQQSNQIAQLKHETNRLREEILILNEKEALYRDRTDGAISKNSDLKEENQKLLFRLEKVERAFRRLFKYREKIRVALPDLKVFRTKALRHQEMNDHLKLQVSELTQRLQRIHTEVTEAQTRLVEDYESQLADLNLHLSEATELNKDRDDLALQNIQLENRSVELERQLLNTKSMYSQENAVLKTDLEQFRRQAKELMVACETQKAQISEKIYEANELKDENSKYFDQVESLQVLWKEKQNELERSEEKNRSLQKLNQDISIKLNEAKRQIHNLKVGVEKDSILR